MTSARASDEEPSAPKQYFSFLSGSIEVMSDTRKDYHALTHVHLRLDLFPTLFAYFFVLEFASFHLLSIRFSLEHFDALMMHPIVCAAVKNLGDKIVFRDS